MHIWKKIAQLYSKKSYPNSNIVWYIYEIYIYMYIIVRKTI